MGGDVERVKERLDIAEVVGGYVKLDKAGQSFKGKCPFHNEKTPSFFVSPVRQSYYCFGCGAKGDIFTFVQELDGLSFREALKTLAERAGIELESRPGAIKARGEKDELLQALETATLFFENELSKNDAARKYILSRGITEASIKKWHLGYAPAEWRALYNHMLQLGFKKDILIKAGLVKSVVESAGKEPYDVFRDRITFPLSDSNGDIIAFSGRALAPNAVPKYLNSPDTVLFTKSEVLYGLDKAKEKIRKLNYAVLVEGQIDLVLSHQVGVENTVASSGTAFTQGHLERLRRLSRRIILGFDGDLAGEKAGEKATELGLSLGLEVKVAKLPPGKDPAEIASTDPQAWKEILRLSLPAIEHFLNELLGKEKDSRKAGKLIGERILPKIALLESAIERSHFLSLISKRTGLKEDVLWEDLKKVKINKASVTPHLEIKLPRERASRREMVEERLTEVRTWLSEFPEGSAEAKEWFKEESELLEHLSQENLKDELSALTVALRAAESSKDSKVVEGLALKVQEVLKKVRAIEEDGKVL